MKSLFENFVNTVIFILMIFTIAGFTMTEMQVMTARHMHTSVVNQYQTSYHTIDIDAINQQLHETFPKWEFTITPVNSMPNSETVVVTLKYNVVLPVFGIEKTAEIDGYAC